MDLNVDVSPAVALPTRLTPLMPNTDPLYRSIPPLAQVLRPVLRRFARQEVPLHWGSTVLGLDARYRDLHFLK